MNPRMADLVGRLRAVGRPGAALSASEFEELTDGIEEMDRVISAYRFVFERTTMKQKDVVEALKTWQPEMHSAIMRDREDVALAGSH